MAVLLATVGCALLASPVEGDWELVRLTEDGSTVTWPVLGERSPGITIGGAVKGFAGCNTFTVAAGAPSFSFDGEILTFHESVSTAMWCGPEFDVVEGPFLTAVRDPEGVVVTELTDGTMVWWWEAGQTEFMFRSGSYG